MAGPRAREHERPDRPLIAPWLGPVLLRALATAIAVSAGFSAISDDDFARLVIAQGFVTDPRFDPSGTSWLPFPFWLTGAALAAFGTSVNVARALAVVTSLGSAALVYRAARWIGHEPWPAALGGAIAAVLPHAVWLGAATVPEGYSAALCLLAIASHSTLVERRRWLGALAITCAALSRYEAWPVAALLALFGLYDAFVQQNRRLLGPALGALVGPLLWLGHGALEHGDSFFFLDRVADYRRALGRAPVDLLQGLLGYPKVLLRGEPELTVVTVLALASKRARRALRGSGRLVLGGAVVLVFLVLGDLGDGAPTHHPERPLLVVWLIACVLVGQALLHGLRDKRWIAALALGVVVALLVRPMVTRRDDFIDRSAELAIGRLSQELVGAGRLAIDTDDYAFFAVMAGFERVDQCRALREHDPRAAAPDPWASPSALGERVEAVGADYLVTASRRLPELPPEAALVARTERYVLVHFRPEPP